MTDTIFKPGEYVTRDGRKARVYATDGGLGRPIHGAVRDGGDWETRSWLASGHWEKCRTSSVDLMPPKQVRYVNVYPGDGMYPTTRAEADLRADADRIACRRIEFTEGQYDD